MTETDWDAVRRERLVKNELAFRSHNNRRATFEEQASDDDPAEDEAEAVPFVCECGSGECITPLSVTRNEYEQAHAAPNTFIVKPDHVYPEVERVIERHDQYWVVEKFLGEMPSAESHATF